MYEKVNPQHPDKQAGRIRINLIMDIKNYDLTKKNKKETGSFYTPVEYALKSKELVLDAVKKAKGDYVIIDRCAGTGNLECELGDELLSHCIVSTLEQGEWDLLNKEIGSKVRAIIPPCNALEKDFIENPIIRQYIDNPKCTIILYENPPYRDESGTNSKTNKGLGTKNKTFVSTEMKKECKGVVTNDILNQFIWSGFKYFLRQPTDSYIVYGPIKYWKCYDICNYKFQGGYVFNRKHFHASDAAVCCMHWTNIKDDETKKIGNINVYDIELYKEGIGKNIIIKTRLKHENNIVIKKVYNIPSTFYPKYKFNENDEIEECCKYSGNFYDGDTKKRVKSYCNQNIIGYECAHGFNIVPLNQHLTRLINYGGNGTYLTTDNYKSLLPLWVAKMYPMKNWWEKELLMTTADGGTEYLKDEEFIKHCFIYSMLSRYNKCKTLVISKDIVKNELCFDDGTVASQDLKDYSLNKDEEKLLEVWYEILAAAKKHPDYNPDWTYGVYQIEQELSTPFIKEKLKQLATLLKEYYKKYISDDVFKYQLIK